MRDQVAEVRRPSEYTLSSRIVAPDCWDSRGAFSRALAPRYRLDSFERDELWICAGESV